MTPENGWLEGEFPFLGRLGLFSVAMFVLGSLNIHIQHTHP